MGLEPASVRLSVRPSVYNFKHDYLYNQKAYSNHILFEGLLGWGKAALGFGQVGSELLFPWQPIAPMGL